MNKRIQSNAAKMAKLSLAVLLAGASIASAQDVPAAVPAEAEAVPTEVSEEAAPVAEPVVSTPIAAPIPEPTPVPIAEPVASIPAPVEAAPAKKTEEIAMVTPGGTKISLYGRLEMNTSYEDGRGNDGLSSMWASQETKVTPQGRTAFSINRTRLGLNLAGPSKEGEPELKGRFEADFSGSHSYVNFSGKEGFRVRQSWGSVGFKDMGLTLLFGQTDDLISPLDPPGVNPSSFNAAGNIGNRRPQIRATQVFGPAELAVAATQDRLYTESGNDAMAAAPAFQTRLGFKLPATWAGEKANLAFGIGYLFARNDAAVKDDDDRGAPPPRTYAIAADLSAPLMDILTLTGEFFMGQNLKRYGDGSISQGYVYTTKDEKKEELGIGSVGWWAGLSLKLPANFSVGTAIGMENLDSDLVDHLEKDKSNMRTGNMFLLANLAYNFTSAAKLTFEYSNISTDYSVKNDDGKDSGSLNRYEMNFRYDFK